MPQVPPSPQLIYILIEADLRNSRLLHGLHECGIVTDDFYTNLHTAIFRLTGFSPQQINDELHAFYFYQIDKYNEIPIRDFFSQLPLIVRELHRTLEAYKTSVYH